MLQSHDWLGNNLRYAKQCPYRYGMCSIDSSDIPYPSQSVGYIHNPNESDEQLKSSPSPPRSEIQGAVVVFRLGTKDRIREHTLVLEGW